ncbi:thioredoxin domain-containing protein [Cellulomonas sp. APG4]|uniref:thioredoxin domain-containing protein n=1 Tax=Cellulomonas sp. APG4 TaxID=1538656 RepID=UPI00137A89D9|nr:thioredoxin domain-containing protein [Cellulomonas sp. APG4]
MPNRLARSTSPYLQQHAENPVDWYEWGEEAFAAARERDVPLLISVGYAACHWCHVMAHESFEDEATAAFMNEHFVNVKVDREERPDVDAVYMEATQATTGRGGWPMTVVATPDGQPFYCGTYFPPVPAHGMPSFGQVLAALAQAWQAERAEVERSAHGLRDALARRAGPLVPHAGDQAAPLDDGILATALGSLAHAFDTTRGGFGGAPKFPPSMLLEWLLRHHARTGEPQPLTMAERTLAAMARGGLHDQLAGGFARYSVDAGWVVPHFEKMLYDNALLLRVYAHWWRLAPPGSPERELARRVVVGTADWMSRELRTPEGGFASALDADSPGPDGVPHEGAFYVWTPAQLAEVLGDDDGAWAAEVLAVTPEGTFEHGTSVLQMPLDPDPARWERVRAALLTARDRRARPARDDKVVAAWNGLAVAALAEAGDLLQRPDWVAAAVGAAELLRTHLDGGRVARASRDGVVGAAAGVLEDHAHVADGFLTLLQVTGDASWLEPARAVLDEVLSQFRADDGGFFDTAADRTDPVLARIRRPRELADGPTPAGQTAAAGALLTYAALTGSARHREAAERALVGPLRLAVEVPRAAGWALAVAEALADGPREIAVVGPDGEREELWRVAALSPAPGAVRVAGAPEADGVALLADRPALDGRPTAYVCRGFTCDRPTTDPVELAAQLAGPPSR